MITFMDLNMIEQKAGLSTRYDEQAALLKVLTHLARLAILEILREGEQCVCHLEAHLGLRQAYISQQLMVLREAGLIQDRRDGWNVFYRVSDLRVFDVLAAVEGMLPASKREMDERRVRCPCPKCNTLDRA